MWHTFAAANCYVFLKHWYHYALLGAGVTTLDLNPDAARILSASVATYCWVGAPVAPLLG
jgi:hypothetical protein